MERRQGLSSLKDSEALYFALVGDTYLSMCYGPIHMEIKQL